jgi:GNAT superfamily N-acetyltransferase
MVPAKRGDVPAMVQTLAVAFVDEPGMAWLLPDPVNRYERLLSFFRGVVPGTLRNGLALRSTENAAVTLWRMPGRAHPGRLESLLGMRHFVRALGQSTARAQLLSQALREREPDFPYWYLQFAGVAPGAQGKGLGGVAVRAGLERARAQGMPVYLETFSAANFALYSHLGFTLLGEWDVPDGPHIWAMLYR